MENSDKKFISLFITFGLVTFVCLTGYFIFQQREMNKPVSQNTITVISSSPIDISHPESNVTSTLTVGLNYSSSTMNTTSWKLHRNVKYGFEIYIPEDWSEGPYSTSTHAFFITPQMELKKSGNGMSFFEPSWIVSYFITGNTVLGDPGDINWMVQNYRNDILLVSGTWRTFIASDPAGPFVTYVKTNSGINYNFSVYLNEEELLDSILNTFRFTTSTSLHPANS